MVSLRGSLSDSDTEVVCAEPADMFSLLYLYLSSYPYSPLGSLGYPGFSLVLLVLVPLSGSGLVFWRCSRSVVLLSRWQMSFNHIY
jgi:hypothetical protein